jgi:hypothetical protein
MSNTGYYIKDNYIYGPGENGRFYVGDGYIYGPHNLTVPRLRNKPFFRAVWPQSGTLLCPV